MSGPRLVLATDLDGTFAHGSPEARDAVVRRVAAEPGGALIYVTGRTAGSARDLAARSGLPEPDVLIADVGTSVLRGFGPARVDAVEAELERRWPGGEVVRERLAVLDDLVPQAIDAPRRVSYWIEPVRRLERSMDPDGDDGDVFAARDPAGASLDARAATQAAEAAWRAETRLEGLDVDVIVSANVFLDVLPAGVNKGTTLLRVLRLMGADPDECVVAGDSLNDLALFETGIRAVAVGNCEPALRSRVSSMAHVYQAGAHGADGLLEGLTHHGHGAREPTIGSGNRRVGPNRRDENGE